MTLVLIHACCCGQTNQFGSVLLRPYVNSFNQVYCENQAFCGYQVNVILEQGAQVSKAFWRALHEGHTVDYARVEAFEAYITWFDPGGPEDFMRVWGDHAMRLNNVYTEVNDDLASTEWYRYWKLGTPP